MLIFLPVLKKAAKNTKKIVISEELIVKTAQSTLEIEVEALKALKISINEEFVACVKAVFLSPGRLVVTGVGKSAIVAQKIVATLNSTGTPSLFMHAADAIHGDLGMIRPDDFVLCISKSGETAEIKALAPLAKGLCSTLIGMVSNRDSFLGKQATYVLHTAVFALQAAGRAHGCSSSPSTWSPPDRPRSASSTTRNNAVVAKPMTMAVSTSDCGSGSL